MNQDKSDFKDKVITVLLIFTFGIPVIPIGLYLAYDHFFVNHETTPSKNINYESVETVNTIGNGVITTPASTFGGYECTSDCSGHEAGYEWAEDNDVCEEDYDGGNSESFAEGVRSYSEDNC